MALFDEEDVAWRGRPCEGPELRGGGLWCGQSAAINGYGGTGNALE